MDGLWSHNYFQFKRGFYVSLSVFSNREFNRPTGNQGYRPIELEEGHKVAYSNLR